MPFAFSIIRTSLFAFLYSYVGVRLGEIREKRVLTLQHKNNSSGRNPVAACGVLLQISKNSASFLGSDVGDVIFFMALFTTCTALSAVSLEAGWLGGMQECLIPLHLQN